MNYRKTPLGQSVLLSTSWGRRRRAAGAQSTSWGRRGSHVSLALLASLTIGTLAAPAGAVASAGSSTRLVVVTGRGAASAAHEVGAAHVAAPLDTVAVARVSPAQETLLVRRGLRVTADQPVEVHGSANAAEPKLASRLSVAALTGADTLANRGHGVTVAVVDSGVNELPGLAGRVVRGADFTGEGGQDDWGHGTFVAGLIAGTGRAANGTATGIEGVAPQARILSVKVVDGQGRSSLTRVMLGLAWVLRNKTAYGIDVVNLSLSARGASSYHYSPLNALVEAAWMSGVTVVASAGNDGREVVKFAPGNDPFVITVGSVYDANTRALRDDTLSPFSNSGRTLDGVAKPEMTSFGQHVQSTLPPASELAVRQTARVAPGFGQLSGTSMSTAVVSGMAAVLRANLGPISPDEVKSRLVASRVRKLDQAVLATALSATRWTNVNAGLRPSIALAAAYAQLFLHTTNYASVNWSTVDWATVPWTTATWTDATWTDATWTDATWTDSGWLDATWTDSGQWTNATWTDTTVGPDNATWTDAAAATWTD